MAINYLKRFFFDFRHMKPRNKALVLGVLLIVLLIAFGLGRGSRAPEGELVQEDLLPQVVVESVAQLSNEKPPLAIVGNVSSSAEVVMLAEATGQITRLAGGVGDTVTQGTLIAEIENSSQRAAVSQARAGLAAAEASLQQTLEGAKDEEVIIAEEGLEAAQKSLEDTIATQDTLLANAQKTLFSTGLEARHVSDNAQGGVPTISGVYDSTQEGTYSLSLYATGSGTYFSVSGLEVADQRVRPGVSVPLGTKGLSITFPTNYAVVDRWTVNVPNPQGPGYLAALNSYNATLESREATIRQAEERVDSAQAQLNLVLSGATSQQISLAQAGVDQARAALSAANSNLAKTLIRSPLSGVITSLPINRGDFVSMFEPLVTVANNETLEVVTYLTQTDARGIAVGDEVVVDGRITGVISSIAPALDSVTQKVEVKVVLEEGADLFNGQSAQVVFGRNTVDDSVQDIFVPLSALKVTAAGVVVFTVDTEGKLESKPIVEGPLVGSKVLVIEGLLPTDEIVVDARGLKVGQEVEVIQ